MARIARFLVSQELLCTKLPLPFCEIVDARMTDDGRIEFKVLASSLPEVEPGALIPLVDVIYTRNVEFKARGA